MSKKKVIKLSQSFSSEFSKYEQAIRTKDYITACSYFNYLQKFNRPEPYVLQAGVFFHLKRTQSEIQCLIKLMTFEKYSNFMVSYVVNALSRYFDLISGKDLKKHYLDLAQKRMRENPIELQTMPKPVTGLRFVDDVDSARIIIKSKDLIHQKKFGEAQELLKKINKKDKNYLSAQNMLTFAYACDNKYDKASATIEDVIKIDPDNTEAMLNIMSFDNVKGQRYKDTKEKLLSANKTELSFVLFKAELLINDNRTQEAIDCLMSIKEEDKYNELIMFNLARCYYFLGNKELTLTWLKKIYIIDNNNFLFRRYINTIENNKIAAKGDLSYILKSTVSRELAIELSLLKNMPLVELCRLNLEKLEDGIRWAASLSQKNDLALLADNYSKFASGLEIIKKLLIDVAYGPEVQKILLHSLIKNICREELFVLLDYKLQKIKLKYPSKLVSEFSTEEYADNKVNTVAFAESYADCCLFLLEQELPTDNLTNSANKVYVSLANMTGQHREVYGHRGLLAAVMVCKSQTRNVDILNRVSEGLGVSKVAIQKALNLIDQYND